MTEKFRISVDPATALVKLELTGFFALEDVAAFAAAQRAAYRKLGGKKGRHRTLCDVSECKIQQQEVVEAFRALLGDPAVMSERIAFVTGASPAKMQIRRLINRPGSQVFDDAAAAEQWLLADQPEAEMPRARAARS